MKKSRHLLICLAVTSLLLGLAGCGISKDEHEKTVSELDTVKAELNQSKAKITDMEKSMATLRDRLKTADEKIAKAEADGSKAKIAEMEKSVTTLRDQLKIANVKLARAEAGAKAGMELKGKLAASLQEASNFSAKVKGLTTQNSELKGKFDASLQKAGDLSAQVKGLTTQNSELKGELGKLTAMIDDLQKKLKNVQIPTKSLPTGLLKK